MLLIEFMRQHAGETRPPRQSKQLACLDPELLKMPLADITPLQLAFTPPEQILLIKSATRLVPPNVARDVGGHRGAARFWLRWSDIQENRELTITRSLTQPR